MKTKSHKESGFSLVETIIAIGVVGISMAAVANYMGKSHAFKSKMENESRLDALRSYASGFLDCASTYGKSGVEALCTSDGNKHLIDAYMSNNNLLAAKDGSTTIGGFGLRAQCDKTGVSFETRDKVTGTWQALGNGLPVFCASAYKKIPLSALTKCSEVVTVTAKANPYLLMRPYGFYINHNSCFGKTKPIDYVGPQSPIPVNFKDAVCLTPGSKLFFNVNGSITNGGGTGSAGADGKPGSLTTHCRPDQNGGLSSVLAPMISFVAVFVGPAKPAVAPPVLDFSTQAARDYKTLSPQLGQVFFVGDGFNSSGTDAQQIVVPAGATSLWMGFNDSGSWADNAGSANASVFWAP